MRHDQRVRLQTATDQYMALSFFHGGQLARGVQAQEGEGSSRVQSLRRLYSETALQEQTKSDTGSQRSYTHSRPRTSQRGDYRSTRLAEEQYSDTGRPSTAYQNRHGLSLHPPDERPRTAGAQTSVGPPNPFSGQTVTTVTATPPPEPSSRWANLLKTNPLKHVKKPSFMSLRREPAQETEKTTRPKTPKSPVKQSWKQKEAARRARLVNEALGTDTDDAHTYSERQVHQQSEPDPEQQPENMDSRKTTHTQRSVMTALPTGRVDTPVAAQSAPNPGLFLAESLAHVIVGEWLYKDPHKPGIFPQSNMFQRHAGPPPRGATGVPQRRWFRIDPYERQLLWSSKWDPVETSQHKQSRKVPIKLVFEIPNRLALDGCIPAHTIPYDYSIVVVAPSKVIKLTAPDELRHSQWLTALQYLVDANKQVTAETWPDVLAARLAFLTQPIEALFGKDSHLPSRAATPYVADKPLPPSPPPETERPISMVPPSIPRLSYHTRDQSNALSTMPDSDDLSEYGSKAPSSVKSQRVEPYTPPLEQKEKGPAVPPKHEHDLDNEPAIDQMDALVSRLSA